MADPTTAIVAAAYALTAASFLIILSRILLRRLKHEAFKPDDYLMLFATVLYAVFTAAFVIAVSVSRLSGYSSFAISSKCADLVKGIPRHQSQPGFSPKFEARSSPIRYLSY
jgi:hypothetical protein